MRNGYLLTQWNYRIQSYHLAHRCMPNFFKCFEIILNSGKTGNYMENQILLTQTHRPVIRLLETFWTFTSLVVLRHLESIWTLTVVTSWTIDTQMAAVVFNILIAFIDICKRPHWNMTCQFEFQSLFHSSIPGLLFVL